MPDNIDILDILSKKDNTMQRMIEDKISLYEKASTRISPQEKEKYKQKLYFKVQNRSLFLLEKPKYYNLLYNYVPYCISMLFSGIGGEQDINKIPYGCVVYIDNLYLKGIMPFPLRFGIKKTLFDVRDFIGHKYEFSIKIIGVNFIALSFFIFTSLICYIIKEDVSYTIFQGIQIGEENYKQTFLCNLANGFMLDMITFVTFDVKIASYYNLSFNLLPIIVSVVWKMRKHDT